MQLMISEILDQVANEKNKDAKANIIVKNVSPALKEFLKYAYSPNVRFYTKVAPKHKLDEAPEELSFSSIFNEYKKFYILLAPDLDMQITGKKPITDKRKNELFAGMLESMHPKDSRLLVDLVEGRVPKKIGLTLKDINTYFPGLIK